MSLKLSLSSTQSCPFLLPSPSYSKNSITPFLPLPLMIATILPLTVADSPSPHHRCISSSVHILLLICKIPLISICVIVKYELLNLFQMIYSLGFTNRKSYKFHLYQRYIWITSGVIWDVGYRLIFIFFALCFVKLYFN